MCACSRVWFSVALIIEEVLRDQSEDSFGSVNVWCAFRFSYAIDVFILLNDGIDLATVGACT